MKKTKVFLYSSLKKILVFLSGIGISKKTPGALKVYKFFDRIFWPFSDMIDIQGSKMYINHTEKSLSMRRTLEAYASNLVHEAATTKLFRSVVKKGDTVVDLGANIGYFSLLAASIVGKNGKVYSFEPEPKNFSYLKKNIEINGYTQIQANQKAVSDKKGKVKLYICEYETGHHTINQSEGIKAYRRDVSVNEENFVEVETIPLDDFFKGKEDSIGVIKMDVEGAEFLALLGMDNILRKNQKVKMFLEFFPLLISNMGNSPKEFIDKILGYGFSISVVEDDYDAGSGKMERILDSDQIMKLCKNEKDHVNLYVSK